MNQKRDFFTSLSAGSVLFWAGFILFMARLFSPSLLNYDYWWHLSAGRFIFDHAAVPRVDFLSHTLSGSPWIDFEWLSQVIFYALYAVLGAVSIPLIKTCFVFSLLFLLGQVYQRSGASGAWVPALILTGWFLTKARFFLRPELFTYLFFLGLVLFTLRKSENGPPAGNKVFLGIAGMFALWANLHGGFVYGAAFLFLWSFGSFWAAAPKNKVFFFFKAGLAGAAGALLNPFGWKIYQVAFLHGLDFAQAPGLIEEWGSPDVRQFWMFWVVFIIGSGFLAFGLIQRTIRARQWAPAVFFFLVLGSLHSRDTVFAAWIAIPFLIAAISSGEDLSVSPAAKRFSVWGLAAVLFLLAAPRVVQPRSYDVFPEGRFPQKAAEAIRDWNIAGKMFNSYEWGGYLGFILGPERPVFMDGRYIFHPLLREMSGILRSGNPALMADQWKTFFQNKEVDHALITLNSGFSPAPSLLEGPPNAELMFPASSWALVFWDDHSFLFLKRIPRFEGLIQEREFRVLRPQDLLRKDHEERAAMLSTEEGRVELARHQKSIPFSLVRNFLTAPEPAPIN